MRAYLYPVKVLISLLLLPALLVAQCDYTPVTLPFTETFCHDYQDCAFTTNPFTLNHPTQGCWNCINQPHYYRIQPSVDTYVVVTIDPDLNSHVLSNTQPQVAGFILFDGCPTSGGQVLNYPWSYSGGACWSWGLMDIYCGWSQSSTAPNLNQGCVTSTPPYTGFAHEVTMGYNLLAGGDYWFCVFPQGTCSVGVCDWGCITVSFDGLAFLDLLPPQPITVDESEPVIKYPRKIYHPAHGVLIEISQGNYRNVLNQSVNLQTWK